VLRVKIEAPRPPLRVRNDAGSRRLRKPELAAAREKLPARATRTKSRNADSRSLMRSPIHSLDEIYVSPACRYSNDRRRRTFLPRRKTAGEPHVTVVLVTGALTGIGRATALAFARAGARVVVSGRREKEGEALAAESRADAQANSSGPTCALEADVRSLG